MSRTSSPSSKERQWLADGQEPTEFHVLVGRGKVCYRHSGNMHLVKIVQSFLPQYSAETSTKKSKSLLIQRIVSIVREWGEDEDSDFIKFDNASGRWFKVDDRTAREKVSQSFRDVLGDTYRSSVTSKTMKRRQERFDKMTPKKPASRSAVSSRNREQQAIKQKVAHQREDYPVRRHRPDPPAMGTDGCLQGPFAGGVLDEASFRHAGAAQNLQRLADISLAVPPSYGWLGGGLSGSAMPPPDPRYADYLKYLIASRENARLSLLDMQRENMMTGQHASSSLRRRDPLDRQSSIDFPQHNR